MGAQAGASRPSSAPLRLQKTFSGPWAAPVRVSVWFWEPGFSTLGLEAKLLLSQEISRPFSMGTDVSLCLLQEVFMLLAFTKEKLSTFKCQE